MLRFCGKRGASSECAKASPAGKRDGRGSLCGHRKYSVLLYTKTGVWEDIVRREMPAAHIIMQDDRDSFEALKRESALLSFSTELSIKRFGNVDEAIVLPVLDDSAKIDFYCRVLKKNKQLLSEFLEKY